MFCSNHRIFGHEGEEAQDVLYVNWLNMVRAGLTGLEYYTPETGRWRQVNTLLLEKMCINTHNHQRHRKFELSEKYKVVIKINIQYLLQLYIAQVSSFSFAKKRYAGLTTDKSNFDWFFRKLSIASIILQSFATQGKAQIE